MIKRALATAAALAALPLATQAQTLQYPGFYVGVEGGGTWMFNTSASTPFRASGTLYPAVGWAAGGMIGYDFVESKSRALNTLSTSIATGQKTKPWRKPQKSF